MAAIPAVPDGGAAQPPSQPETSAFRRFLRSGTIIRWLGFGGAWIPTLMLVFILVILFVKAWPAILITGLAFGLAHGLVLGLPVLSVFGITLGWLRWKTGSVYPGMCVHALFNAAALAAAVLT